MTFSDASDAPDAPFDHPYRSAGDPGAFDDGLRVPYRGQTRMRFTLSSGLANGTIAIDPAARDLIAVHGGDGPPPRLRVVGDDITLTWRGSFADWLRGLLGPGHSDVVIVLHPAVAWTLALQGGLSHVELELSAGLVERIDIHGGCTNARFALPLPKAAVPIRIAGGACQLEVQRPAEAGVSLATAGGLAALRLDDQRFAAIGGPVRLETRNFVPGAPGYELHIAGGAAALAIERA